ncbi:hypothetical protein ACU639_00555 [Streptomyces cynarae]
MDNLFDVGGDLDWSAASLEVGRNIVACARATGRPPRSTPTAS